MVNFFSRVAVSCLLYSLFNTGLYQLSANTTLHLPRSSYLPLSYEIEAFPDELNTADKNLLLEGPFFQLQARSSDPWRVQPNKSKGLVFTHPYIKRASVTFQLFPADLFFPDDPTIDWKTQYLNGLRMEHLSAELLPPVATFIRKKVPIDPADPSQQPENGLQESQTDMRERIRARRREKFMQRHGDNKDFVGDPDLDLDVAMAMDAAEDKPAEPEHPQFSMQSVDYRLESLYSPAPLYCRDYFVQLYDGTDVYCLLVHFEREVRLEKIILEDMFEFFFNLRMAETAE